MTRQPELPVITWMLSTHCHEIGHACHMEMVVQEIQLRQVHVQVRCVFSHTPNTNLCCSAISPPTHTYDLKELILSSVD